MNGQERKQREFLMQKEKMDSFYQKLQDGFDVNILIVGDSIGAMSGASDGTYAWGNLLVNNLKSAYGINVNIMNVSMGGNSSYAGYVRTMELELDKKAVTEYDLAIICYGQNDSDEKFSLYYESLIRAIQFKYRKCSIISILESSQKEYTEKMKTIQELCAYYHIPVADTIAPFIVDKDIYNSLTNDGVHPNDNGQKVYYETVMSVIEAHIGEEYTHIQQHPVNDDVVNFEQFLWIGTEYSGMKEKCVSGIGFTRIDALTYNISCQELGLNSISGIMGIDYTYQSGENKVVIYVDGKKLIAPTVMFDYDFSQRHILLVNNHCTVQDEIKVIFKTKEQADGFKGICFSNNLELVTVRN